MIAYRQGSIGFAVRHLIPVAMLKRAFAEVGLVASWIELRNRQGGPPTAASIQAAVCAHYRLRPLDMQTERRHRDICRPRQIAMYLCRELTPRSLPQIGRAFGGRDHTTVIHACRQIERLRASDPTIDEAIVELTAELSA